MNTHHSALTRIKQIREHPTHYDSSLVEIAESLISHKTFLFLPPDDDDVSTRKRMSIPNKSKDMYGIAFFQKHVFQRLSDERYVSLEGIFGEIQKYVSKSVPFHDHPARSLE